jgi:hypothetical protein
MVSFGRANMIVVLWWKSADCRRTFGHALLLASSAKRDISGQKAYYLLTPVGYSPSQSTVVQRMR